MKKGKYCHCRGRPACLPPNLLVTVAGLLAGLLWPGCSLLRAQPADTAGSPGAYFQAQTPRQSTADTVSLEALLRQNPNYILTDMGWSYSRYSGYGHRVDFNLITVSPGYGYMFEVPMIPIAVTRDDPFDNDTAVSLSPLLSLGLFAGMTSEARSLFNTSMMLRSLLNSRHHFLIVLDTRRKRSKENIYNAFSIFVKNNTDLFAGRHWWTNLSPGIGINALVRGIQFQAGYNVNFEFSTSRSRTSPWFYGTVGLVFLVE